MRDNILKYYSFAYLFRLNGGIKGIFLSKTSWDFYLSVFLVLIAYLFNELHPLGSAEALLIIGLEIALLGLILAIYTIIYSIRDETYLSALIASKNYQYLLFQTTWTSYWIFFSIFLLSFIQIIKYFSAIQAIAFFAVIYSLLGMFILITQALRKIAITAARKNEKLQKSWEEAEKKWSL